MPGKSNLKIKVSVGGSKTSLQTAHVNDGSRPTHVKNEHFEGDVVVRVKNFDGIVPDGDSVRSSDETYFSSTSDTSSMQFRGIFHGKDLTGDDLLFGNDFDEPIKDSLPPGTSLGLKAMTWIDPALETDLYCDKPWAFSPLLATMTTLKSYSEGSAPASGSAVGRVDEDTSSLVGEKVDAKTRRSHFGHKDKRARHKLDGLTLEGDFSNPFIDFNTLSIQLPYVGLHINILQYWSGQPIRYVCKTRAGDVLFCIVFELVDEHGKQLTEDTIKEEQAAA
ncbi:hypothetical protein PYCC9005_000116 [Savitreella phatthalungensis]